METHKEFTKWAASQGVKIGGIAAHRFPGKGLGIIAKKRQGATHYYSLYCFYGQLSIVIYHFCVQGLQGSSPSRAPMRSCATYTRGL